MSKKFDLPGTHVCQTCAACFRGRPILVAIEWHDGSPPAHMPFCSAVCCARDRALHRASEGDGWTRRVLLR